MGGPAHHVSILSGRLDPDRFETLLVSGRVGPGEEELSDVAARHGARHEYVEGLGPEIDPATDLRALRNMGAVVRGFRPDIVHTHTAKAGMIGRSAAVLAARPRPIVLHTYHGHVLEGYFGPARNALYRGIERGLGRVSDRLVGVSQATVDDLLRLRIAPPEKLSVVPLGLDLEPFTRPDRGAAARVRSECGAGPDDVLFTFVGRLVPVKRVDLALGALARAREAGAPARLAIVGDGELRAELETLAASLRLSDHVRFLGYRRDLPELAAAGDAALLSSANEGTPVSLIEAGAAGLPAAATAVGGVREVVGEESGLVVSSGDERALGAAIATLAGDAGLRQRMGEAARERVLERYSIARLVGDVEGLYTQLLARP